MKKDEYSPYKVIHHMDKLNALKNHKHVSPIHVQLVISNRCNQRCSFCAYRMKDFLSNQTFCDTDMLSYNKIIECLDNFRDMDVKAVQYTGGGEPLMHPDSYNVFKHTLENGLDMSLVTNGMALDDKLCELLGNISWIRVSVDSATDIEYSLIRSVSKSIFNKVLSNIKTLIKYKKSISIGVGFVVNKENYSGIYDAAKLFKDIGVDNFRISGAFTPLGFNYFSNFKNTAIELSKQAEELSDDNFTVFNLFTDRLADLFVGTQDYDFCPMKELQCYIGADYNIYMCCTLSYNNHGFIGSIKDNSFRDIWESDTTKELFLKHSPRKSCKHQCLYRNKNDFMNYCIKQNPTHSNFI